MSRSGYTDDCENIWLWRGAVKRAIDGKRGQAFLRELVEALDTMPEKRLIADELQEQNFIAGADIVVHTEVCALGAMGIKRGVELRRLNPDDHEQLSKTFGIASSMIAEIEHENDEGAPYWVNETPEQRWQRMRDWAAENLKA